MKKIIVALCLILIQVLVFLGMDQMLFLETSIYQKEKDTMKFEVIWNRKQQSYDLQLFHGNQLIHEQQLPNKLYKNFSSEWIKNGLATFTYTNSETKETVSLYFDFEQSDAKTDDAAIKAALNQQAQEKEQENLISTETGLSLTKGTMVFLTYDYGKHWVETDIPVSSICLDQTTSLRLSQESYQIDKDYTYFYTVTNNGHLAYVYSKDEGVTWNWKSLDTSGWDIKWFQAGLLQGQPYFFQSDGIERFELSISQNDGETFSVQKLSFDQNLNEIADTSLIDENILFVCFQNSRAIYRSEDGGASFMRIQVTENEDIVYFLGPLLQNGVLNVSGMDHSGDSHIFTSNDMGKTWERR